MFAFLNLIPTRSFSFYLIALVIFLLTTFKSNAQVHFSDDFSSGNLNNWTLIDDDGDGLNWLIRDYDDGVQEEHASSSSWESSSEPLPNGFLTPDNWMVSPAIDLTGVTGTTIVEWKVHCPDPAFSQENYTVYAANSSNTTNLSASATNFNEIVGPVLDYQIRTLDISAFNGSMAYIGFRHHNVTGQFRISIDDVEVRTLYANDAELSAVNLSPTIEAGSITISGEVRNAGTNTINSFDVTWDDGNGPNTATFNQTLNYEDTYSFSHTIPWNAAAGAQSVDVCVSLTGDSNPSNDCISKNVSVVSSIVDKYVVIEEKTGTWCNTCPSGMAHMYNLSQAEPKMIGIAIHHNDPMELGPYDNASDNFIGFQSYPYVVADRVETDWASQVQGIFDLRENMIPPASITFDVAENSNNIITVTASANMVTDLSGDYRIAVVLLEDNVTGTGSGWLQVNGYSGGSSLMQGSIDWSLLPDPVDVSSVFGGYDDVSRALGDNAINGSAGLPATLTNGNSYSQTYTFNYNSSWNINNMRAVAMFIDNSTGEILNAAESDSIFDPSLGLAEKMIDADLKIYPNPVNDLLQISTELETSSNIQISIYNTIGQLVYDKIINDVAPGLFEHNIDMTAFQDGLYTVNMRINGNVISHKISVY